MYQNTIPSLLCQADAKRHFGLSKMMFKEIIEKNLVDCVELGSKKYLKTQSLIHFLKGGDTDARAEDALHID